MCARVCVRERGGESECACVRERDGDLYRSTMYIVHIVIDTCVSYDSLHVSYVQNGEKAAVYVRLCACELCVSVHVHACLCLSLCRRQSEG